MPRICSSGISQRIARTKSDLPPSLNAVFIHCAPTPEVLPKACAEISQGSFQAAFAPLASAFPVALAHFATNGAAAVAAFATHSATFGAALHPTSDRSTLEAAQMSFRRSFWSCGRVSYQLDTSDATGAIFSDKYCFAVSGVSDETVSLTTQDIGDINALIAPEAPRTAPLANSPIPFDISHCPNDSYACQTLSHPDLIDSTPDLNASYPASSADLINQGCCTSGVFIWNSPAFAAASYAFLISASFLPSFRQASMNFFIFSSSIPVSFFGFADNVACT